MFSRRLGIPFVIVAAVIVVGVSSYNIVTANSSNGSPIGTAAIPTPTSAKVILFTQGQPSPTQAVGPSPTGYVQGGGTIVTDRATAAALAVYPAGTIDRVAPLGCGDYEVYMIAVNWPHHVIVNNNFILIGAE